MSVDLKKLEQLLARFRDIDGALLPVLHAVQEEFGYVPPETILPIAKALRATPPQVYAIVTFYSEFRTKQRGKKVVGVCRGPACRLAGAARLQQEIESRLAVRGGRTSPDGSTTVETVSCLGICSLAPAISVGNDMVGRVLDVQRVEAALEMHQADKREDT